MVLELGHFDKNFVKIQEISFPQGNILEFFLFDTLETIFWVENYLT